MLTFSSCSLFSGVTQLAHTSKNGFSQGKHLRNFELISHRFAAFSQKCMKKSWKFCCIWITKELNEGNKEDEGIEPTVNENGNETYICNALRYDDATEFKWRSLVRWCGERKKRKSPVGRRCIQEASANNVSRIN